MKVEIEQGVGHSLPFLPCMHPLLSSSVDLVFCSTRCLTPSFSPCLCLFPYYHLLLSLSQQEYDKWLWSIDTSPCGQKQTAKDWVYPPDLEREVTNQSLGNLVTLMNVVDKVSKEKRMITMGGEYMSTLLSYTTIV